MRQLPDVAVADSASQPIVVNPLRSLDINETVAQLGVLRTMKAKDVYFRAIPRRAKGPIARSRASKLAEKVRIPTVG